MLPNPKPTKQLLEVLLQVEVVVAFHHGDEKRLPEPARPHEEDEAVPRRPQYKSLIQENGEAPVDVQSVGFRHEHVALAFVAADELDALRLGGPAGYFRSVLVADGAVAELHGHRGTRLERRIFGGEHHIDSVRAETREVKRRREMLRVAKLDDRTG